MLEEGKHYHIVVRRGTHRWHQEVRTINIVIVKINIYGILCQYYKDEMAHPEREMIQFNYNEIEELIPLGY